MPLTITPAVQRRFILGRQGLWPGRRWSGKEGTAAALHAVEALQIDPVNVVAPSHDIALWGRVLDYRPDDLHTLAYRERRFFDYGGALYFYTMEELPYWRVEMERRAAYGRWHDFLQANSGLLDEVRAELRARGPLRKRDLDGAKVDAYRGSKDSGVALYALWMSGELMTHHREGRERFFDFRGNIAPPHLQHAAHGDEAETVLLRKGLAQRGLVTEREFRALLKGVRDRPTDIHEARAVLAPMLESGEIAAVEVTGRDQTTYCYCLAADIADIQTLLGGAVPAAWSPIGPTTEEEVVFLSPLEFVSARGRAAELFDFDYIWEIYKPAEKRRYGPYTMPILYGDRLVGRIDARYDRTAAALEINGIWLEDSFDAGSDFNAALQAGLARFERFLARS